MPPLDPTDRAAELHEEAETALERGLPDVAKRRADRAYRILVRVVGDRDPDVANVELTRARVACTRDRFKAALEHATHAEAIMAAVLGAVADGTLTIESRDESALLYRLHLETQVFLGELCQQRGDYSRAEVVLTQGLEFARARFGRKSLEAARVANALGVLSKYLGKFSRAERLYRGALPILLAAHGEEHTDVATIHHNLGGLDHARGRFASGEPHARKAVEIRERACGPRSLAAAYDRAALAPILAGQPDAAKHAEAESIYRAVLRLFRRRLGKDHYEVAATLHNLGSLLYERGELASARRFLTRALAIKVRIGGARHPDVALTLHNLAALEDAAGRLTRARALAARAARIFAATLDPSHPLRAAGGR